MIPNWAFACLHAGMQQPHQRASGFSSSMPAKQLYSAKQLMLLPQTHGSTPPVAIHTPVAVSLHPSGSNSVTLELTAVRDNLQPAMAAPSLPSHKNASSDGLMSGPTQTSAPHVAGASGIQASLQPGSQLLHMDAVLEELTVPLLDTQGPPLLDTQGPPLGYTEVDAWKCPGPCVSLTFYL